MVVLPKVLKQDFFENEYVQYWIEDGIIMECFKKDLVKIDLKIAKVIVQDRLKNVTKGVRMPMFVDTNKSLYMDKESREYFAGAESLSDIKASALLINNTIAFLAAKLFLTLNRPKVKFEFFSDKEKALEWLQKFK
jgi:hypothetical protein